MATTLGNGLGPRTQICPQWQKVQATHTQADPDAVEKALGPHTHNPRCGRYNWYRPSSPAAVQGTADVLKLVLVITKQIIPSLTVVADFTD